LTYISTLTIQDFVSYFPRGFPPYDYNITEGSGEFDKTKINNEDVQEAFDEAYAVFNENLFNGDQRIIKTAYFYLVAHYLTSDLISASKGVAFAGGLETSKSVGDVSVGYTIPQVFQNNPQAIHWAKTLWGQKYMSLLAPYLTGLIMFSEGTTTLE